MGLFSSKNSAALRQTKAQLKGPSKAQIKAQAKANARAKQARAEREAAAIAARKGRPRYKMTQDSKSAAIYYIKITD